MKHNTRASFWKYLEQLPTEVQEPAHKNFELMQLDERYASISLKKVGKRWSTRVGENYRALAYQPEVGLIWFWIGPHHEDDKFL